jgi:hypothetical protein
LKHCRLRQDMAGQGSLGAQKHGCGSGLRFSNGSTAISFCYPGLLGSSFQRVQLIATAKASSDAITAKIAGFF